MVDEPYRRQQGLGRRRQPRRRGPGPDTPTVDPDRGFGPDLEEAQEIRGRRPAQPERVDPPTERVLTNAEELPVPGTRLTNAEEIPPGTRTTNIEDAALADRRSREQTGNPQAKNTEVTGTVSDFRFKSNILSNYENPTYHFRLSVTNPEFIKDPQYLQDFQSLPRIVVAETANSQYFIEDVTIDSYVNFDPNHRNQGVFKVDMTIVEPTGSSFLDHVYNASIQAGVSNWMQMPYILELWFLGRDPVTGEDEVIESSVWSYILYVATPQINVDSGGTKYTFTFRGYEHRSLQPDMNIVDSDFEITAVTVGEFLDKLSEKLNKAEESKRQSGPLAITTYKWDILQPRKNQLVSRPVRDWSIIPKNFNENSQRHVSVSEAESGKTSISVSRGTNLGKLIENIIGSTDEGVKLATGLENLLDVAGQEPAYEWKYIPAVEAILNYGDYVVGASDYNKEVTYQLFFRRMTAISINTKETKKVNNAEKQRRRLISLNRSGLLSKRYDYIYTGRNTEVLNFDLQFNTLWRAPALYYGSVYHYEATTTGPKVNEQKNNYIKGVTKKKQLLNEYAQAADRALAPDQSRVPPQDRGVLRTFFQDVKGEVEAISGGQVSVSEDEWNAVFNRQDRQAERERKEEVSRQRFKQQSQRKDRGAIRLEDLPEDFIDKQQRIQIALDQFDNNPRMDIAQMTESDWKPTKSLFGLAIHQAYGMSSGDLARMEIEIRGDFYWLGRANSEFYATNSVISNNNYQIYNSEQFIRPDYNEGSQHLLLNFGYPRNPNDPAEINRDRFASAVYIVTRATHKFEGGKFTQTLTTVRDPLTNPDAIGGDIFKIRSQ
jgi:hypothetical protein